MEGTIVGRLKGEKILIKSCLARQTKNIDYGKDDVDEK